MQTLNAEEDDWMLGAEDDAEIKVEGIETTPCEACGVDVPVQPSYIGGRIPRSYCGSCAAAQQKAEVEERAARDQQQRIENQEGMYACRRLPARLHDFPDDFRATSPAAREVLKIVARYCETLEEQLTAGHGIILWGPNGTGKSTLAAALFSGAKALPTSGVFVTLADVLAKLRAGMDRHASDTEQAVMSPLCRVDLLVLDDVGQERLTEWGAAQLFTVIDARYRDRKSVIVTTNRTPDELKACIGAASFDRLAGSCRFLELNGPSHRWDQAPSW